MQQFLPKVLSAHEYLVDSNIPEALASSLLHKGKSVTIAIKEDNVLIITNKNIIVKEITIIDKNVLENYSNEDLNRTISTHEAGHSITGIALMGILPDMIKQDCRMVILVDIVNLHLLNV